MLRRLTTEGVGILAILVSSATAGLGQEEGIASPLGFAPGSRAAQARAEAHALAVPTPDSARALAPHPDRGAARRRHPRRLQDRPLRPRQAPRVGLEGRSRRVRGPAQLSRRVAAPARAGTSVSSSGWSDPTARCCPSDEAPLASRQGLGQPRRLPRLPRLRRLGPRHGPGRLRQLRPARGLRELWRRWGSTSRARSSCVRYGELFRGLKVRNAQKRGATGILIYSDPADDGYAKGDVYPNGPFRPGSAIQRGSVQFLSLGPGDPSTPIGPSVKGAKRLPFDAVERVPARPTELPGGSARDPEVMPSRSGRRRPA